MGLQALTANKESFVFPEPIFIRANPMAPTNVVGATVNGTVTRPDGSIVPLTLFDDGLAIHGDIQTDDGVYSTFFSDFKGSGTYSFEIVVTTPNGFLFTGEGLFAFLDLGFIPPAGASNVPAPTFTRTAGFAVTVSGVPIPGDLDGDGDVDRDDLNIILAARNTPATGPDDPRDLDGDGTITALDARKLTQLCTRLRCTTE